MNWFLDLLNFAAGKNQVNDLITLLPIILKRLAILIA